MIRLMGFLVVSILILNACRHPGPEPPDILAGCAGFRDMINKMSLPHGMFGPRCYGQPGRTVLLRRTGDTLPRPFLIVLVHGWGGDSVDTWGQLPSIVLNAKGERRSWLNQFDLLTYSFETGLNLGVDLQVLADQFGQLLILVLSEYHQYRDIFLITHSLGGLLAQRTIVDHISKGDQIVRHLRGNIFIAPPNEFLPLKGWYDLAVLFERRQVPQMGLYSPFREKLNDDWDKTRRVSPREFDTLFCKNTLLIRSAKDDVVDYSTMPNRFCDTVEIAESDRDHVQMVKIDDPDRDLAFLSIEKFLRKFTVTDRSPKVTLAEAERIEGQVQKYEEIENFQQALELNKKLYGFYLSNNDPTRASQRLVKIGENEFLLGNFVLARKAFIEARQIATQPREPALANLGISSLEVIDYDFRAAENSLINVLAYAEDAKDSLLKTKVYLALAHNYITSWDWVKAEIYLSKLQQQRQEVNFSLQDGARQQLLEAGLKATRHDQYEKARKLCDQASNLLGESNRVLTADALMCRARMLILQGKDVDKALLDAERALAIYKERSARFGLAKAKELIAYILVANRQFAKAEETMKEAEILYEELGAPAWSSRTQVSLGQLALRTFDYPSANSYFTKARAFMENLAGTRPAPVLNQFLGQISLQLGKIYTIRGMPSVAASEFIKAERQFIEIPNYLGVFYAKMYRIPLNIDMGEMVRVQNDLTEAKNLLPNIDNPELTTWFEVTQLSAELRNPTVTTSERLERLVQGVEAEQIKPGPLQGYVYNLSGQFARLRELWPQAQKSFALSSAKFEAIGEKEGLGLAELFLGEAYYRLGNQSAASTHLEKAARILNETGDESGSQMVNLYRTIVTMSPENLEVGISKIQDVLAYLNGRGYRILLVEANLEYVSVLCKQKHEAGKAKEILSKSLQVSQQTDNKLGEEIVRRKMSEINRDGCP